MFHNPFRNHVFFSPDDAGGMGDAAEPIHDPTEETAQEQPEQEAAAQNEAAAEEQPAEQTQDKPVQEKQTEEKPEAEERLEKARQRIMTAEMRSAAALAGVPKERIGYVLKLADTTGIDLDADDADEKIAAAIGKVLDDLPELRGKPGGTGAVGNFARRTGETEDPDFARIQKNILG